MIELIAYFLALMNPFALFIYTLPLLKEFEMHDYVTIIVRATAISWAIYIFFAIVGLYVFNEVLNLNFNSFRIFGGLVLISFALSFILQGKESMVSTKGELSKIASEVALPFMVGAGTIALSVVVGERLGPFQGSVVITTVMAITALMVIGLAVFRLSLKKRMRIVLDKNLEILLRINGFIVGAFGVDLIVIGIRNLIAAG